MRPTIAFAVLLSAIVAVVGVACGTSAPAPEPMPASVNDVGPCATVPALQATRVAVPGQPACAAADRAAADTTCGTGDVVGCYGAAFCDAGSWLPANPSDARSEALADIQTRLSDACAKGVAEACLLRAGVAIELGSPAKETCGDVVRACQLGDEATACLSCVATGC